VYTVDNVLRIVGLSIIIRGHTIAVNSPGTALQVHDKCTHSPLLRFKRLQCDTVTSRCDPAFDQG